MLEWDPASITPKSQGYSILLLLCCWLGCAGPPQKPGTPPNSLPLCPWAWSEGLNLLTAVGRGFSRGESWAIPAYKSLVGCWGSLVLGFRNSWWYGVTSMCAGSWAGHRSIYLGSSPVGFIFSWE